MKHLIAIGPAAFPALVGPAGGERAQMRFLEFFAANIRNPPRSRLCSSCRRIPSIGVVQPVHVAIWIAAATRELAAPSVKQRLNAISHLFDWLVTGRVGRSTGRVRCAGPAMS
jgi:integrase/recombinase XerC